jgi:hypothetical protein
MITCDARNGNAGKSLPKSTMGTQNSVSICRPRKMQRHVAQLATAAARSTSIAAADSRDTESPDGVALARIGCPRKVACQSPIHDLHNGNTGRARRTMRRSLSETVEFTPDGFLGLKSCTLVAKALRTRQHASRMPLLQASRSTGQLAINAMTLSGVIRRMSAGERPDRKRWITSDRDV